MPLAAPPPPRPPPSLNPSRVPGPTLAGTGALADQAKGTGSLAKAKTLPPPKAAKMVSRFDTIAKSKRKLKPLEIKLEAIYIQDPGFKKYASLARSKDEQRKIRSWFRDRRRSAKRKQVRDLAAAGEL